MSLENEAIARALRSYMEDELPSKLDEVEAEWADTEAITLPDPEEVFIGHRPEILTTASSGFPIVSITATDREPEREGATEWGYQSARYDVLIDVLLVASDRQTVNFMVLRYAQAIVKVLQDHSAVAGHNQSNYEPHLEGITPIERHMVKGGYGDVHKADDVDYFQAGRLVVTLD